MSATKRRFPAEWEKQQGVLLCFPHNGNDWPGKYEAVKWAFVEFIKKVATFEEVFLMVADENQKEKSLIENSTSIFFKKLNEILKKSNCKEKFYLLYGGNDLGAFLLDEKQFEIIKERYKGNSGDIPYLP